jgi:hypothetical protein
MKDSNNIQARVKLPGASEGASYTVIIIFSNKNFKITEISFEEISLFKGLREQMEPERKKLKKVAVSAS